MALVWDARIQQAGVPSRTAGRDQRFDYDVRPAFTAKMACRRVNPQAGCNPIEAVTLKFASPVARATALAATLSTADGQRLAAKASDSDRNDPWLTEVRSEEHTSELQSLMRISYAVFCLQKKN